jgi:hypothetical protein
LISCTYGRVAGNSVKSRGLVDKLYVWVRRVKVICRFFLTFYPRTYAYNLSTRHADRGSMPSVRWIVDGKTETAKNPPDPQARGCVTLPTLGNGTAVPIQGIDREARKPCNSRALRLRGSMIKGFVIPWLIQRTWIDTLRSWSALAIQPVPRSRSPGPLSAAYPSQRTQNRRSPILSDVTRPGMGIHAIPWTNRGIA